MVACFRILSHIWSVKYVSVEKNCSDKVVLELMYDYLFVVCPTYSRWSYLINDQPVMNFLF